MKKVALFLVYLMIPALFVFTSCGGGEANTEENTDNATEEVVKEEVKEFDLLMQYIEDNGDFINSKKVPTMIAADKLKESLGETVYVIDIRDAKSYAGGHINGAVNVKLGDVIDHMASIDAAKYEKVVMVCYSGQTASYAGSVLQLLGYGNVYVLKWGMGSWDKKSADAKWMANISDNYVDMLETTANPKPAAGEYPVIETGEKDGKAILEARARKVLQDGFKPVLVKADDLFADPSAYFIINYWPEALYNKGHIPGAIQYQPKSSLGRSTSLNTLPTDKPIVTYCFTGQHAAFVSAYLNILGYNAKSLAYGANSFMNSKMKDDTEIGHAFSAKQVQNFEMETSEYVEKEGAVEEVGGC